MTHTASVSEGELEKKAQDFGTRFGTILVLSTSIVRGLSSVDEASFGGRIVYHVCALHDGLDPKES